MPHYRVQVNIEADIEYLVKADTEDEAKQTAIDMADDGMSFANMNISWREVGLITDESAEHEP